MEGEKKQAFMPKNWNKMMETLKTFRGTTDSNHSISHDYVNPFIATFYRIYMESNWDLF